MRTHMLLPAIVCLSGTLGGSINAREQRDAAGLERVLAQIQKLVPAGWVAGFELVDPRAPLRRGSHPAIVIKSEAELPVDDIKIHDAGKSKEYQQILNAVQKIVVPYEKEK